MILKRTHFLLLVVLSGLLFGMSLLVTASVRAEVPQTLPKRFQTGAPRATLLEFYAQWCHTCQRMEPIINRLEREAGQDLRLVRLDIEALGNKSLSHQYEVSGTPTYFLYDKEGKLIFKMEELISSSLLQTMVYKATGLSKAVKLPKRRSDGFQAIETSQNPFLLVSFHDEQCVPCKNANGFTALLEENYADTLSTVELTLDEEGVKKYRKSFSLRSMPSYALIDQEGFLLMKQDKALSPADKKTIWRYIQLIQAGQP